MVPSLGPHPPACRRVAAWGQEALTKLASTPLDQQKDYSLLTCFKLGLHDPSKVPTNLPPGLPLEQVHGCAVHAVAHVACTMAMSLCSSLCVLPNLPFVSAVSCMCTLLSHLQTIAAKDVFMIQERKLGAQRQ